MIVGILVWLWGWLICGGDYVEGDVGRWGGVGECGVVRVGDDDDGLVWARLDIGMGIICLDLG